MADLEHNDPDCRRNRRDRRAEVPAHAARRPPQPAAHANDNETAGGSESEVDEPDGHSARPRPAGPPSRPENVSITQGGADRVDADSVHVTQGGITTVTAQAVEPSPGRHRDARVPRTSRSAWAASVSPGPIACRSRWAGSAWRSPVTLGSHRATPARSSPARRTIEQALVGTLITGRATIQRPTGVLLLVAGRVEGPVKAMFDWRGAIAFGAAFGVVLGLLRRR